eukprot:TRINITY_DN608_c0_g1_i1.p1 TRINITY_DN608_c0_g1~~TRINITY_DN608_c0_g1_i1.p1  ORF type:complete len:426 (+),score=101.68 TRINITY_DN608_c0_g1_i1:157-1434(+)
MKKVGKYLLTATLGKGAFSVVLLGKDTEAEAKAQPKAPADGTAQPVVRPAVQYAVKMCEKARLVQMDMLGELENEISVLQQLKSRYVANLHDVIQTGRYYYLVLDLCRQTLMARITGSAARRLDEGDGRRYFQELMLAVYSCHQQGVVHRDVKPENILLTDDDHVKLSDFGFACPVDKLHECRVQCGTRQYLAPEVFDLTPETEGFDGFAADVWSCGVVLYAMLCGRLPFADHDHSVLRDKIRAARFAVPPWLQEPALAVLTTVLVPEPRQRPSVFQVMGLPWFQVDFDISLVEAVNAGIRASACSVEAVPPEMRRHLPGALRRNICPPPQEESFAIACAAVSPTLTNGVSGTATPPAGLAEPPAEPGSASSLLNAVASGALVRPHPNLAVALRQSPRAADRPCLQVLHVDPAGQGGRCWRGSQG